MDTSYSLIELTKISGFSGLNIRVLIMLIIGGILLFLAIVKKYEPLLLIPIAFGAILANLPFTGLMEEGGFLNLLFFGIRHDLFPILIFMGIGAMTDFGPLLANPLTFLLGAAAQLGISVALLGAVLLGFSLKESAAVAIIGGASGPTSIYLASKLAPHLLGAIAVASYSYMALVPLIQPPIMKIFTTEDQKKSEMKQLRQVSKTEKILFPIISTIFVGLILPSSVPLVCTMMLGNLFRESMVTNRLSNTAQNELINIVTIFLGLCVGATMQAEYFLTVETLKVIFLGLIAFAFGTFGGVIFGRVMYKLSGGKINPLIGAAGVSAVPMSARVVQTVGQKANPQNFLLMHAMGPNVAGAIGTTITAGVLLTLLK